MTVGERRRIWILAVSRGMACFLWGSEQVSRCYDLGRQLNRRHFRIISVFSNESLGSAFYTRVTLERPEVGSGAVPANLRKGQPQGADYGLRPETTATAKATGQTGTSSPTKTLRQEQVGPRALELVS